MSYGSKGWTTDEAFQFSSGAVFSVVENNSLALGLVTVQTVYMHKKAIYVDRKGKGKT